jgi:hypothetical protein
MVSRYYAAGRTDHRHVLRPNTTMSETDKFLSERLSDVDTDAVEAIQHDETYSLVNSTNGDEWITADQKDTMEIRQ